MGKKIAIILSFITFLLFFMRQEANAQAPETYTHYVYNKLSLNPGYASNRESFSGRFVGRLKDANSNGMGILALQIPIVNNRHGIGAVVEYGKESDYFKSAGRLAYAYGSYTRIGKISAGVSGGLRNMHFPSCVPPSELGFSPDENLCDLLGPEFGAGIYLQGNRYYAGVAVPNFLKTKEGRISTYARSINAMAGVLFEIGYPLDVVPSALFVMYENGKSHWGGNLIVTVLDRFDLGFTYRYQDRMSGLFSYYLYNGLSFGYAFDWLKSETTGAYGASHNLFIGFDMPVDQCKNGLCPALR